MISTPLSHRAYCTHVSDVSRQTLTVPVTHVQVRHRGVVLCGQVQRLAEFSHSGEWYSVDTQIGPVWVESRNVRLCSGDGRCHCEVTQ